jgi:hypothetical protein
MASPRPSAVSSVVEDLQRIFGTRLHAVVLYGWRQHAPAATLVLVDELTMDDLNACASHVGRWHRGGAATPLLLTRHDFARSLDAFPIEYGEILVQHEVLFGHDPFEGLSIRRDDLRRACEVQVKSHLLHLREDYVESAGNHADIESLVRESAPGFAALLRHLARLDDAPAEGRSELVRYAEERVRLDGRTVGDLLAVADSDGPLPVDVLRLFPAYLSTMERLAEFVDRWREA